MTPGAHLLILYYQRPLSRKGLFGYKIIAKPQNGLTGKNCTVFPDDTVLSIFIKKIL
jgi:hypothetical protein